MSSATAETLPKPQPRPEYITGGCLCGAVRYKVRFGEKTPWPPRSVLACQCTQCRKATGSLVAHIVSFYDSQIEWSANTESSPYMRTTTFPLHHGAGDRKASFTVRSQLPDLHSQTVKSADTSEVTDIHKTPPGIPGASGLSEKIARFEKNGAPLNNKATPAAAGASTAAGQPAPDQFAETDEDNRDFPQFIDAFTDAETHVHANESAIKEFCSSPGVTRTFCAHCGSTLTWRKDEQDDTVTGHGDTDNYGNKAYNLNGAKLAPETEIMAGTIDEECLIGFIDSKTGQGSGKRHDPERKGLGIKLGQELCRPVNGNDWFRNAIPGLTDRVISGKVNMGRHQDD